MLEEIKPKNTVISDRDLKPIPIRPVHRADEIPTALHRPARVAITTPDTKPDRVAKGDAEQTVTRYLLEQTGPLAANDIVANLNLARSTVKHVLDRLSKSGYLRKRIINPLGEVRRAVYWVSGVIDDDAAEACILNWEGNNMINTDTDTPTDTPAADDSLEDVTFGQGERVVNDVTVVDALKELQTMVKEPVLADYERICQSLEGVAMFISKAGGPGVLIRDLRRASDYIQLTQNRNP